MQTNQVSKPLVIVTHFLGTGPLEYYYTLWSKTLLVGSGCYYHYRRNLSHEYEAAIAKATELTGQTSWQKFDISEYRRTQNGSPDLSLSPDEIILTFGKYDGQTLGHVLDTDIEYVLFLALKSDWAPRNPRQARVINYIRAMFKQAAQEAEDKKQADRQAARQERDAQRADLPEFKGRVTIQGTVISTKCQESQYGSVMKMLVEHADGWKIWGTIPAALSCINQNTIDQNGNELGWTQVSLSRGDVVRFDATIEKSDRDPKFGFFARATKAALVKYHEGVVDTVKKGDYPHVTVTVQVAASASQWEPVGDADNHFQAP